MKQNPKRFSIEEIEPSPAVKSRLDVAFKNRYYKRRELRLPYFQTMAAAVLLLAFGIGIGRWFDKPVTPVERIVQQIHYVDRPVKEIQYIRVPVQPMAAVHTDTLALPEASQDLAVAEVSSASTGISMGDDSLLQKMMVTIY